jgi:small subunit ribosomal protein S4
MQAQKSGCRRARKGIAMSRYTGPRLRKVRRLGVALPGLVQKETVRMYPPGMHGQGRRPKKPSDYSLRLRETQKLRFHYGLRENQLRHVIRRSIRSKVASDTKLLSLLESRLDNAVFRSGLAPTNRAARQVVSHNHLLVNGKRANIPSMTLSAGDVITIKEKSSWFKLLATEGAFPRHSMPIPGFLDVSEGPSKIIFVREPLAEEVCLDVDPIAVVERYSGRV